MKEANLLRTPPPAIVDGIRWHFAPQATSLLDPNSLSLSSWIASGQAQVVKDGPHRTVFRVDLPAVTIFFKRCKILGIRGFLRQCLRPPKAKMEFDRALQLRSRGIATIEPLAWGVQAQRLIGESFLITRALPDALPLLRLVEDDCLNAQSPGFRQRITKRLGWFLAQLHEAGVAHPDLHAGNLLWMMDGDREGQFFLIDLHDIEVGSPLGWKASRNNLILLNRWAQLRTCFADRRRFLRSYLACRPNLKIDWRRATGELEKGTAESNFFFWRGRVSRCLGRNRYFRPVRAERCKGHAVHDINEDFLKNLLADPDAPFRSQEKRALKDSRSSTVVELDMPTLDGPRAMIYKRFRRDRWYDRITPHFYLSPALRSWVMGHALCSRALPTPKPWLVLQRFSSGLFGDGYLLCEKVLSAQDLHRFAREWAGRGPSGSLDVPRAAQTFLSVHRRKWQLLAKLACLIRDLHERFLAHRDLKAANILVSEDSQKKGVEFSLIDLVGVRIVRLSVRTKIQNLARLHISFRDDPSITKTDKLRFLRAYLCWGIRGRGDWKRWWKELDRATKRKRDLNARRGRPLS